MPRNTTQQVLNQIAKFWRAGLSGFLLLNLALLQAAATPANNSHNAPAFSSEIQSAGHSVQRDWQRVNLHYGNEISSGGGHDDQSSDAPLFAAAQPLFNVASLSLFHHSDAHRGSNRFDYFLPEPRAAPQA